MRCCYAVSALLVVSVLVVPPSPCHGAYVVRGSRSATVPGGVSDAQVQPVIQALHITTDIKYRFATTLVSTRVVNPANQSGEATFTVNLPESAFISDFLMEVKGTIYKAFIKGTEEANAIYQEAVQTGQFAGHAAPHARDSNQFTVSVNIEAYGKVTFNLTYEQLLTRQLNVYSNIININPQQVVEDMLVTVNIEEPSAIVNLEVPELQLSNDIFPENLYSSCRKVFGSYNTSQWGYNRVLRIPAGSSNLDVRQHGFQGTYKDGNNLALMDGQTGEYVLVGNTIFAMSRKLFNYGGTTLEYSGPYTAVERINSTRPLEKDLLIEVLSTGNLYPPDITYSYALPRTPLAQNSRTVSGVWANEFARIEEKSQNKKQVIWAPKPVEQQCRNSTGMSGQFIVRYDVDREENPQQVLVDEGYFVHFFAPEKLPILRKHIVFVLDFSGSMDGRKLDQLKDAMKQIFSDLNPKDHFSVVIFQSEIEVWSPSKVLRLDYAGTLLDSTYIVEASPTNIQLARSFMASYSDLGATNIMGGLRAGLKLVSIGEQEWTNESDPPQPLMMFLTDGQPNEEEEDINVIINKTKGLNVMQCPVFSLAFGDGADYDFLRKLSLQNVAFARKIYEAADATQQLENFYASIASPLMSKVSFTYLPGQVDDLSYTNFPAFYSGSELVVAGRVSEDITDTNPIGELQGISAFGPQTHPIIMNRINTNTGHLEKAWVYLNIQQLLDRADSLDDGEEKNKIKEKVLDLALKYAFVTPLTSLVLVKPNETASAVDAAKMKRGWYGPPGGVFTGSAGIVSKPHHNYSATKNTTHQLARPQPPHKISMQDVDWVQKALNVADPMITVTVGGTTYKLGINETNSAFGSCQVNNDFGECHHLQYCALDVFRYDVSQFLPYRCPIAGGYLGVCCLENFV